MMLKLTSLLFVLLNLNQINVPEKAELGKKIIAQVQTEDALVYWFTNDLDTEQIDNKLFIWGKPGTYKIEAVVIPVQKEDSREYINGPIQKLEATLEIISNAPEPPPPNPEVPFPSEQLTVLILKESKETGLPIKQQAIFTSPKVLQYLNANSVWRIWDDDFSKVQLENAPEVFREAYPLVLNQMQSLPWIAISNKTKGTSQPLPDNIDSFLELIEEYK